MNHQETSDTNPPKKIIAIDGYSGSGKTTLAKDLAKKTNYIFIDTGAMYRAVTWFAIKNNLICNHQIKERQLIDALHDIELVFKKDDQHDDARLWMNGEDVEDIIRTPEVAKMVAQVASIAEVRQKLIAQQRQLGKGGGVVLDGRDIASVVYPNADLKLFVTADPKIRAERRWTELQKKGVNVSLDEVLTNLLERDRLDENRAISPLVKVPDAFMIDTSQHTRTSQLEYVMSLL